MSNTKAFFILFLLSFYLIGCETLKEKNARTLRQYCSPANNIDWVMGGNECLSMALFGKDNLDQHQSPKTLLIYIAGDFHLSNNTKLPYTESQLKQLNIDKNQALVVLLSRPGYSILGDRSTGNAHNGLAYYSQENVDILADAIDNLKQHYRPERVVLVGNSSGASMSILLISQYHNIADSAIIISCPCDFFKWSGGMRNQRTLESLDPIDFVDKLPKNKPIYLFVGSKDVITPTYFVQHFFDKSKAHSLNNVQLFVVDGANHIQTKTSEPVLKRMSQILAQ